VRLVAALGTLGFGRSAVENQSPDISCLDRYLTKLNTSVGRAAVQMMQTFPRHLSIDRSLGGLPDGSARRTACRLARLFTSLDARCSMLGVCHWLATITPSSHSPVFVF